MCVFTCIGHRSDIFVAFQTPYGGIKKRIPPPVFSTTVDNKKMIAGLLPGMPLGDMSVAILALVLVTQCPPFSLVLFSSRLCYLPIFRMAAAKKGTKRYQRKLLENRERKRAARAMDTVKHMKPQFHHLVRLIKKKCEDAFFKNYKRHTKELEDETAKKNIYMRKLAAATNENRQLNLSVRRSVPREKAMNKYILRLESNQTHLMTALDGWTAKCDALQGELKRAREELRLSRKRYTYDAGR